MANDFRFDCLLGGRDNEYSVLVDAKREIRRSCFQPGSSVDKYCLLSTYNGTVVEGRSGRSYNGKDHG